MDFARNALVYLLFGLLMLAPAWIPLVDYRIGMRRYRGMLWIVALGLGVGLLVVLLLSLVKATDGTGPFLAGEDALGILAMGYLVGLFTMLPLYGAAGMVQLVRTQCHTTRGIIILVAVFALGLGILRELTWVMQGL